jgi:hypothetical protein
VDGQRRCGAVKDLENSAGFDGKLLGPSPSMVSWRGEVTEGYLWYGHVVGEVLAH